MAEQNAAKAQAPEKQESALSLFKKTVVDITVDKVRGFLSTGELTLPTDYSPENAMKSAWLTLQEVKDKDNKPALTVCETSSVAASMLDMVVQGLNPMKKQCYFIVYGTHLSCQRSYFGDMAIAKRLRPEIDDFSFNVVYDGDEFAYNIVHGEKQIIGHKQSFGNVKNSNIIGAYAEALDVNGNAIKTEVMTIEQIHQSWRKSKTNPFDGDKLKATSNHGMYPVEYAIRTVIRKLCKPIINASSDSSLLRDAMNRTDDMADRAELEEKLKLEANQGPILEVVGKPVLDITDQQKALEPEKLPESEKQEVPF